MGQAHAETIPKPEAEGGSRISLTCNCCPLQPPSLALVERVARMS